MKKLYIKHFGLLLTMILIIGEIIFVGLLYPKRDFITDLTERHFYEYMEELSGELTSEKEAAILAEQERIVDARNAEYAIETKLRNGEYSSEEEFISEYEDNHLITQRKEAFDLVFEQYSYALESPQNRYLTSGDYNGLSADFPDILLLALVIFLTAILFLNEESSNVITFVRISENGKQKTLWGKVFSILILILFGQIFRILFEFFTMISRGNLQELSYPIQTIEYFQNSPYDLSILQTFLAISALRLLGYLFVAAFVILLSVTLRRALFTVFIPSALCLLQQFAFNPATPAYYIPTGLLRAVGYFRGNILTKNYSGDEVKLFSEIQISHLTVLIIATLVFIAISIIVAYNYYSCKSLKFNRKIEAVIAVISLCGLISGCAQAPLENIKFNFAESRYFAQDTDCFFISDNRQITQISKNNYSELELVHNAVADETNGMILLHKDNLYYLNGVGDVNKISLSDYGREKIFSKNYYDKIGFLGINLSRKSDVFSNLFGFFSDGKSYYYIYNNRILRDDECIIDESIYNFMLCFDGEKIYYINSLLQLKCYDTKMGAISRLPGEFVRAIFYDGTRLLYSDKNGIFSLDTEDNSTKKISELPANHLTSDGGKIACMSEGKLYLLDDTPTEIYDGDFDAFAILSNINKLAVIQYRGEYMLLDFPN